MCPESVGDALQRNSAAKYGEVKCLGLSRPNRKLRKRAGETKKKNGPSPLRGAERRSADLKFVGGAESFCESFRLRQLPSLTVGNISKIDGSRDAHFLESNGEKGKNYRFIEECNEQRRSLLYVDGPNRQAEINSY